jgi:hypothetical protein
MNDLQPFLSFRPLESERPSQSAHPRTATSSITRISNKGALDAPITSQHEALSRYNSSWTPSEVTLAYSLRKTIGFEPSKCRCKPSFTKKSRQKSRS